jgi:methionine-rich copper-binding protein CopC
MRSRSRTVAVVVAVGLCWLIGLGATPALAHAALEGSSPEQGAVFPAPPKSVRLTFSEDLGGGSLAVTAAGRPVTAGASRVEGSDLVIDVAPGAPAGVWTVAYRVVSADGHPVSGQFTFTVKAKPAGAAPTKTQLDTPSPTASPSAATTPAATPPSTASGVHALHSPVMQTAVAALALVALVLGVFVRRRRP